MSNTDRVAIMFILFGFWFLHRAGITPDANTAWAKEILGTIFLFAGAGGLLSPVIMRNL